MDESICITSAPWGDLPLPGCVSRVWLDLAGEYQGRRQWTSGSTQALRNLKVGGVWHSVYLYEDDGLVRMRASGDQGEAITVYMLTRRGWQPAPIKAWEYQGWYTRNRATLDRLETDLGDIPRGVQCRVGENTPIG